MATAKHVLCEGANALDLASQGESQDVVHLEAYGLQAHAGGRGAIAKPSGTCRRTFRFAIRIELSAAAKSTQSRNPKLVLTRHGVTHMA